MGKEQWLWVPGYEGRYMVSSEGRIASMVDRNGWGLTVRGEPLILTNKPYGHGYCVANLAGRCVKVHQAVLHAFVGPPPSGMEASHLNGIRHDNRLANLKWESRRDNFARKIEHGTAQRGTQNGNAIINDDTVRAIRAMRMRSPRPTQHEIAAALGTTREVVKNVLLGYSWTHVQGEAEK